VAVHARDAFHAAVRPALSTRADAKLVVAKMKQTRHAPRSRAIMRRLFPAARHINQRRAAQAAAWRKRSERFNEIGFSGAVLAEQANWPRIHPQCRIDVITKIRER
jgi:hypothetical protein